MLHLFSIEKIQNISLSRRRKQCWRSVISSHLLHTNTHTHTHIHNNASLYHFIIKSRFINVELIEALLLQYEHLRPPSYFIFYKVTPVRTGQRCSPHGKRPQHGRIIWFRKENKKMGEQEKMWKGRYDIRSQTGCWLMLKTCEVIDCKGTSVRVIGFVVINEISHGWREVPRLDGW